MATQWFVLWWCTSPLLLHTPTAGSVALTNDLNTPNAKVGEGEGGGVGCFVVPPHLLSGWGGDLILILMIDDTGCRVQPQCVRQCYYTVINSHLLPKQREPDNRPKMHLDI